MHGEIPPMRRLGGDPACLMTGLGGMETLGGAGGAFSLEAGTEKRPRPPAFTLEFRGPSGRVVEVLRLTGFFLLASGSTHDPIRTS